LDAGKSLSCIRTEEAFGYPQIFILSLLLFLDGGILYAGISGPLLALLAPNLIPGSPDLSRALWTSLLAASLPLGVLLLADGPLEASTLRFYGDLPASESFHMELGTLLPCLSGLIFGAPVSAVQCKLNVLFVWMWWVRPTGLRPADGPVIRNTFLFWLVSCVLAASLPALLAWSMNRLAHY
jgi:phosphate/sulfate permease